MTGQIRVPAAVEIGSARAAASFLISDTIEKTLERKTDIDEFRPGVLVRPYGLRSAG
jgi:hypothetical protein